MQPTIRKANLNDLAEVSRLNLDLFKIQHEFDPTASLDWTLSQDGQEYFKSRISQENSFVEIAETENGKLIGYIIGTILTPRPWRTPGIYAELESIFVEKEHQGSGLGSKLINNFVDWCKTNKVNRTSLLVDPKNKSAIEFYKKYGFKDYDLVMELDLEK